MKPIARSLLAIFAVAVFGGCAQSYHPFYTEKSKVKVPELVGEWLKTDNTNDPPWVCTESNPAEYLVQTFDDGKTSTIKMVTFKIGMNLFCDVTAPDNLGDQYKMNCYLAGALVPVHYVSKLDAHANTVAVTPLDREWIRSKVLTNTPALAVVLGGKDDDLLFTASSEQWEAFLAKYGNDPVAFPTNATGVFKRRPAPTSPKKS